MEPALQRRRCVRRPRPPRPVTACAAASWTCRASFGRWCRWAHACRASRPSPRVRVTSRKGVHVSFV